MIKITLPHPQRKYSHIPPWDGFKTCLGANIDLFQQLHAAKNEFKYFFNVSTIIKQNESNIGSACAHLDK